MPDDGPTQPLASLPSVRALFDHPDVQRLVADHSRALVLEAVRRAIDDARQRRQAGEEAPVGAAEVTGTLERILAPSLRRVINATGVVLHTNLGRAPLAAEAIARTVAAARSYANLELELDSGARGGRGAGVEAHLRALTGAQAAMCVNNGAAAALLALSTVAAGKEVVVSRGELVEIGGGFRVPEVLAQSGCRLVEVGTTNRTRLTDYRAALTAETGALLKVHRSNFRIVGFSEEVPIADLAKLAREANRPLVFDQGTGDFGAIAQAVGDGADVVVFSGDKLAGGPQAGLVVGREELVLRMRRHPLARALRVDRLRLAALEATLALWRRGKLEAIPAARMLVEDVSIVRARAERLAVAAELDVASVQPSEAAAGGGTRPGETVSSYALVARGDHPHVLAALLRSGEVPVIARVKDGAVLLDARTIADDEVEETGAALRRALARYAAALPALGTAAEPEALETDEA